jgi:two-component system, OmpR family, phosphate regulon sensor histidine kinase PhoR
VVASRVLVPEPEDLWRLTMEQSPVGMAIVSPAGDVVVANVALCRMLGFGPDALRATRFQDLTHPDDLAADLELAARCLSGEISSYRITQRFLRADGGTLVGDLSVALLRAPDGTPIHFIAQVADSTERQGYLQRLDAAEAVLESQQRRAEAVFDSVAVGLLLLDADGSCQGFNSRHQELMELAFPSGDVGDVGRPGFLYDADQTRVLAYEETPHARAVAGEEFDDFLVWVGEDVRTRRALSVSARSIRDRCGALTGTVLAHHDVTDLMRALRAKDEFVTHVSHELRTPLTSAMAYLELIGESVEIGPAVHRQVSAVRRNVARLSHLVADLLYATRVTSGSSLVDPYRVDVVTIVAEALDAARVEAAVAGVTLEPDLPDSLMARVDGIRLRQVVDNLVGNAVAYVPRGGRVTVVLEADEVGLALTVADDGEGIEAEDQPYVFDRFFRGQNAARLRVPGAGLGLDIVRTIVEAHRGEVLLASVPGHGTTVRVTIPR